MPTPPYNLILGPDRANQMADLCLIDTQTDQRRPALIETAPERRHDRLAGLCQQFPTAHG